MTEEIDAVPKKLSSRIASGAEIAGGAIGGALGLLGGPVGAVAGGAGGVIVGKAIGKIGEEIAERMLGPRERTRLGAVIAIAANDIQSRTQSGEKVRHDDFFEPKSGSRAKADEIAESILLRAQREAEEAKIPYMGYLLSNIAFDSTINVELAHQLVRGAETLTYRQLVLLRLSVLKLQYALRSTDYRQAGGTFSQDLLQILYEALDLYQRAYLNFGGEVLFGPTDVAPAKMTAQGLGAHIHNLMSLQKIPIADIEKIARILT